MNELDFNCYNKLEDFIDYDGFVAPNGDFYKVSLANKHNPTHNTWADKFVIEKLDFLKHLSSANKSFLYTISKLKTKQDILIHYYGFIYYGHDSYSKKPIIIYPDSTYNDKYVTQEQLDIIFRIFKENNELDMLYLDYEEKIDNERHERYIDSLISKQIERNF